MTHNERVLQLLSDGKPHSHHEGYALHVVLHSRVSDLRAQGYAIEHWREGRTSYYQLVEPLAEAPAVPSPLAGASASGAPPENPGGSLADDQGDALTSGAGGVPLDNPQGVRDLPEGDNEPARPAVHSRQLSLETA